jgi:hypothetical protein
MYYDPGNYYTCNTEDGYLFILRDYYALNYYCFIGNDKILTGATSSTSGRGTKNEVLNNSLIVDNLTTGYTGKVLDARQGKRLKDLIDAIVVPTKTSDLTNDSGYITGYTETDPIFNASAAKNITSTDITNWNNKSDFSGNYNDLSNKPTIPDELADLSSDSTHRTVTDTEKTTWNNKSDFSGDYDDLTNKPTIPSEVTESTVSGWGFTKNTGTYSKPSGGIPKTDLASAVQTSLEKADTALQSYTESDPVFSASPAAGITASNITVWNNKVDYVSNDPAAYTYTVAHNSNVFSLVTVANGNKIDISNVPTTDTVTSTIRKVPTSGAVYDALRDKQDTLVSGTNIKTINSQSIVGSGNVDFYGTELPIGTEVDYDGSTVPSGWVETENRIGKLLWEGSFTSGSITVPGISDYVVVAMIVGGVTCLGSQLYGGCSFTRYNSLAIDSYGYRFTYSAANDRLTIDSVNKGGTSGTASQPITKIYGVF